LRRHDTPKFVKRTQRELIEKVAEATTRAERKAPLPQLLQIITRELDRLRCGQVPLHELVLTYHLSRDPEEYQTDTLSATVAGELAERGVTLNPGESVRYVITEYQADVPSDRARAWEFIDGSWGYDVARYTELLMRAVESVLVPFGVTASMLRGWLEKELPAEHLRARLEAHPQCPYFEPLLEFSSVVENRHSSHRLVRAHLQIADRCNLEPRGPFTKQSARDLSKTTRRNHLAASISR
jgi:hypothetical protein